MFRNLFKKTEATYKVTVPKLGIELDAPSDVTILEHALTKGFAAPHSCRVGTCGTCKVKLVSGKVYELSDKAYTLSGEELAENYILICQSLPRSEVVLEYAHAPEEVERIPVVQRAGTITGLRKLTHDIVEVEVTIDEPVTYRAGQY
ncbi:MAG: 2Fe-2S iron-sulfur cluster-binding protein, partial [Candidatus Binatia bacterium]